MKLIYTLFLATIYTFSIAQPSGNWDYTISKSGSELVIEVTPVNAAMVPTTGDAINDMTFSISWPTATGVTLMNPTGLYDIAKAGITATNPSLPLETIQGFAIGGSGFVFPPVDWTLGVPVEIARIPFSVATPDPTADARISDYGEVTDFQPGVGINGTDEIANTIGAVPLPIKLTSFTALKFEDRHGKLDWSSSSEINASHFEIERSTNTTSWEKIGVVKATGESSTLQNYEFVDRNVGTLRSSTTFYYRLKMVDNDGSFEYSAVRSITFSADGVTINVYPNPTTDRLSIDMTSEIDFNSGDATAYLRDNNGKVMLKNTISTNGVTEISMNDVPSGMFLLQVEHNNKVYTQKVIKID